ncbi:hypothetical protein O3P69_020806 [Scylla paramamosain]|uniref:5-hydroxyisourate hydrolase n=3 Tax=Scylla paramamosain TaxID=85552 RepID=A0AAW0TR00_SCYPA
MLFASSRLRVIANHLSYTQEITTKAVSKSSMSDNPLTSHVLDTATGRPAANMRIVLHKLEGDAWQEITTKTTNCDGRAGYFVPKEAFTQGTYKILFDTGAYFKQLAVKGFYPYVEIVFVIENPEEHYHVPLLISPYGYSTYRGS